MKFSSLLLVVYSFFIILCNGCKEMPASKIRDKDSVSLLVSKKLYKWVSPSRQLGKDSVWSDDWKFVADSVFHGHHQLLK